MQEPLLMIPGPIEVEPAVLEALAAPPKSHLDPGFIQTFGDALRRTRNVFLAEKARPFIVAGSGTLAMEMAVANVIEEGDHVVVVDTGYFSDRIAKIATRHGGVVTRVSAEPGAVPEEDAIRAAIATAKPKVVTITHVDTSTAVCAPVETITRMAREAGALVIVDGVCSIGGEEYRHDAWGVDIAFTASQKALGAPPGLAILVASERALAVHAVRKTPVHSMYADFAEWLPIMQAYESSAPAYFATPPVNLIAALAVSLEQILEEGMDHRFARHKQIATTFHQAWHTLGLEHLPREGVRAHTLSALFYPKGVDAKLVGLVREEGVVIAGGLHPSLRPRYFRVGHMGKTGPAEIERTVGAITRALRRVI